jgi:hypothetical protein
MGNELAVMAIKGGRYSEAEQMFNNEITTKPTPMSYYGLGLCKLNMILDVGRTTDEVFYCFEKAISAAEENDKAKIEMDVIAICISNLEQLQSLFSQLEKQKKKQANAAMLGAALTVGAAMVGSSGKSNAFTQISSLAVAGAGVGMSLEGLSNLETIPEMQNKINELTINIKTELNKVIKLETTLLNSSLDSLTDISIEIKQIEDSSKWYSNKTTVILLTILIWPVGLYGWYKRSKDQE